MQMRSRFLCSTALGTALVSGIASAAVAADPGGFTMPAVSAPNGKLGAFAGAVGDDFAVGATGSLAIPLSGQWGAQVDGLAGEAGGDGFFGVAGHLFWRDPSKGLVGLYGSWVGWDGTKTVTVPSPGFGDDGFRTLSGASVGKIGVEGEAYLQRFSLEGMLAYQFGTATGLAARGTVAYYATDNLRFDVGAFTLAGVGAGVRGGLEWAPQGQHFSLFADATGMSGDNWSAVGGIRVFFGDKSKSLIDRHRQDDPLNLLPEDLHLLGGGEIMCDNGSWNVFDGCTGGS